MHGNHSHAHQLSAPLIAGVNAPSCDDAAKRERRRIALQQRPDALACAHLVLALQEFESRPPPINASDVARRELSLKRAEALAMTTDLARLAASRA
jgi:hypothetical protein